jgi:hypothetical protein
MKCSRCGGDAFLRYATGRIITTGHWEGEDWISEKHEIDDTGQTETIEWVCVSGVQEECDGHPVNGEETDE